RPAHVPADRVVDFDMFAPTGGKADIYGAWKTLQASGIPEIVWTPRNGGHWIATRGKQIAEIYADYERFSARILLLPKEAGEEWSSPPSNVDPPRHRQYRALLNGNLSPKAVGGMEGVMRKAAVDLIEGLRRRGRCNFVAEFAEIFPLRVF